MHYYALSTRVQHTVETARLYFTVVTCACVPVMGINFITLHGYLGGRGGQLSPHHRCDWAGPDWLGSLHVWDRAGFAS